ncbi:AAA family ATPase [Planctomycetota bacterium]
MPRVIVIGGPNGAGKSTLAPVLLRDRLGLNEFVNADTIARGLSAFAPERVAFQAGRVMLQRLRDLAAARSTFAFETTLASRSYAAWLRQLAVTGYAVEVIYLWLRSSDLAVERVRQRVRRGGHDIPEADIRRRYDRGRINFIELYSPMASTWVVLDNSETAPVRVAIGGSSRPLDVCDQEVWAQIIEGQQ